MYNKEFKERFLDESGVLPSTQKTYRFMLEKAEITETQLGKDIYQFTPYECDQLIYSFSRKSNLMVAVIVACFKRYLDFCILNNQVDKDYFNYFGTISGQSDIEKYVDITAIENKFLTFDGILEIEDMLINEQDTAQIELLFCGVNGKRGSELINLKVSDVHEDKIVLPNREIPITPRTYKILIAATYQKEYWKGNGDLSETTRGETLIINPTEYVLRPAGSTKSGELTYSTLQMRINRIKELFGNDYITLTSIWHSGMLYHLSQIKESTGSVTNDDYRRINKLFGYSETYAHQSKVRFEQFL